jgi:hypothetical protein
MKGEGGRGIVSQAHGEVVNASANRASRIASLSSWPCRHIIHAYTCIPNSGREIEHNGLVCVRESVTVEVSIAGREVTYL